MKVVWACNLSCLNPDKPSALVFSDWPQNEPSQTVISILTVCYIYKNKCQFPKLTAKFYLATSLSGLPHWPYSTTTLKQLIGTLKSSLIFVSGITRAFPHIKSQKVCWENRHIKTMFAVIILQLFYQCILKLIPADRVMKTQRQLDCKRDILPQNPAAEFISILR